MKIDFNQEEYIKQRKIQKRLEELNKKRIDTVRTLQGDLEALQVNKEMMEEDIKNNIPTDYLENKIKEKEAIIEENEKKLTELEKEIQELESIKKNITISEAITYDENGIVITDKETITPSANQTDDKVIVHVTNFFPKNKTILCNYDGNKTGEVEFEYNGEKKEVKSLSHRHTVHFTINSVALSTGDGAGDWKQPKFIIVEPLEDHKDQFVSALITNSDEFTYGSVKLGEKPILLVREDAYSEIPKEEISNYNIIKYSGKYNECVNNLLLTLGYKLTYGDANTGNHSGSDYYRVEKNMEQRNVIINYLLDNKYDGKENITFSIEEISKLYDIFSEKDKEKDGKYMQMVIMEEQKCEKIVEETTIPKEFIKFCINFGLYKSDDKYKILDDDKMLEKMKKWRKKSESNEQVFTYEDYIEIIPIYIDYLKYKKSKIVRVNKEVEEVEETILDINITNAKKKYENRELKAMLSEKNEEQQEEIQK